MVSKAFVLLVTLQLFALSMSMPQQAQSDAEVVQNPDGSVNSKIQIQSASLALPASNANLPDPGTNEVEIIQGADPAQEQKIIDAIVKELQTTFTSRYQEQIKEKLPDGKYPVRGFSASNGIELNGAISGLDTIKLSKAFEASANRTGNATGYNVKAEMEIPNLEFTFDLVKYFPIDVFKLFPVRGTGKANMTAYLPLETKTTPNAQASTAACVSAIDSVARADNVKVDVVFTNALGRGLQWIRNNLNLDLADSVLSNFAKTIVDVVMSILQLIICGAIEAATKSVLLG